MSQFFFYLYLFSSLSFFLIFISFTLPHIYKNNYFKYSTFGLHDKQTLTCKFLKKFSSYSYEIIHDNNFHKLLIKANRHIEKHHKLCDSVSVSLRWY